MMKYFFRILAVTGLLMTLIPSIFHYFGSMPEENMKNYILIGAFIWFAGAIPWLGKREAENN